MSKAIFVIVLLLIAVAIPLLAYPPVEELSVGGDPRVSISANTWLLCEIPPLILTLGAIALNVEVARIIGLFGLTGALVLATAVTGWNIYVAIKYPFLDIDWRTNSYIFFHGVGRLMVSVLKVFGIYYGVNMGSLGQTKKTY